MAGELLGARHAAADPRRPACRPPISTPFRVPIRWLGSTLAASCAGAGRRRGQRPGRACRRLHRRSRISAFRPTAGAGSSTTRASSISSALHSARDDLRPPRPAAGHRRSATCSRTRARRTRARRLARRRLSDAGRTMLSARRPRLSPARRRADARELDRAQHVVRRARLPKDELRGFDDHADGRAYDDAGRASDADDPARLPRSRAAAAASLRAGQPGGRRVAGQPHDVRLTIDATCSFAWPRSSRPTRGRRPARLRRWCSIPIPASCWRASAIRGRQHRTWFATGGRADAA